MTGLVWMCFGVGCLSSPPSAPPTIVISIVPGTMSEDCEHIAGKIKTLLERYELEAAVEVVESIVTRYQTPDDDPEKVCWHWCEYGPAGRRRDRYPWWVYSAEQAWHGTEDLRLDMPIML